MLCCWLGFASFAIVTVRLCLVCRSHQQKHGHSRRTKKNCAEEFQSVQNTVTDVLLSKNVPDTERYPYLSIFLLARLFFKEIDYW